jgi:hypothetical protein
MPPLRRAGVDVGLVAVRIGHAPPPDAFKLVRGAGLEPTAAQRLDLRGRRVQVVDDEVKVQPFLARLCLRYVMARLSAGLAGFGSKSRSLKASPSPSLAR